MTLHIANFMSYVSTIIIVMHISESQVNDFWLDLNEGDKYKPNLLLEP